jgi:hypothetical protein
MGEIEKCPVIPPAEFAQAFRIAGYRLMMFRTRLKDAVFCAGVMASELSVFGFTCSIEIVT